MIQSLRRLGWLTLLGLVGCGCAVTLYQYPAVVHKTDGSVDYHPLAVEEVYFFRSPEAFPPGLRWVEVCELLTPQDSQWPAQKLVSEFQARSAENGANAVVFDSVGIHKMDYGFLYYTGHATAYRLYRRNPAEDVDLSSSRRDPKP